jgi:TonB family protein
MPAAATALSETMNAGGDLPFKTGMIISGLFHLMVLGGIPLLLQLISISARFERPPTFQLVVAPPSVRPAVPRVQKKNSKQPVQKAVKKNDVHRVPKESAKPEENLDELASVLDEIPAPARVSAVGDFKYNWYLAQTQEKIERYWNPSFENKKDSVVISFTIYSDGAISAPAIYRRSGSSALDNAALRAVTLAAPFGKLPPGVSGNQYEMMCTLRPTRN